MNASWKSYLLTGLLVALLVCPPPLLAAVIVVGGSCTLVDAITAANTDSATGGCPAGSGADEIELTGDVSLTEVDNTIDGPNGLPSVISEMIIRSDGGTLRFIDRESSSPAFRIFHVGSGGDLSLERVVVSGGYSGPGNGGGGILNLAQLGLTNTTVSGNSATYGGGIENLYGAVVLTQSAVSGNWADYGGGIDNSTGTLVLSRSTVLGNFANRGAGIRNYATATLTNSLVSGNTTYIEGGGIFSVFGAVDLTNSAVSGNWSYHDGGGISNVDGSLSLTNSTVSGNSASYSGGGISNVDGSLSLTNSTVSGNSATYGGGIYSYSDYDGTVTLTHSTVSGNSATSGGGIYNYIYQVGTVSLTGSLVGLGPGGENCAGEPITDAGHNLADDATCGTIPDTLTGLDPVLADNGGPTLTHALLSGSNAIDMAGDCGLAADQRLAPRDDGSCDSGSFEFGSLPDEIFADGFESGDTSAWTATAP